MKKKQSGQALVEFVMILPILILLTFSFIDFGRILFENNRLENLTNIVIDQYQETNDEANVEKYLSSIGYDNIDLDISHKDGKLTIELTKYIEIMTPGLSNIIGNPYRIKVERVVGYEQ